jgi:hypothetical protein
VKPTTQSLCLALLFLLLVRVSWAFDVPDYKLRFRIDRVETTNAPPDVTKRGWFIHGGKANTPLKVGDWSDWIEISGDLKTGILTKRYPNLYLKKYPVVTAFTVHPHPFQRMQLSVEWETADSKGTYSATYATPSVAALLWLDDAKKHRISSSSEYNQRYVLQAGKLKLTPENLPKQFTFVDRFIGIDGDEKAWDDGVRLLTLLGFNTIADAPKSLVARQGITRTAGAVYWPPLIHDADARVTNPQAMDEWAQQIADGFRKSGWEPRDVAFFALADEPGWYYPAAFNGTWPKNDPEMRARLLGLFREYLKAKKFRPADFGSKTWDGVEFLGRSGATNLPAKRRYYWTMRFFADHSADVMARWTQALERAFYPGMPIACNWNFFAGRYYVPGPVANNADKQSPDAAMGGHDWIDFGRKRGVTALWTEDWFGDAMAPQWSFYMSKLRSAADHYNLARRPADPVPIGTGGYVIGATTGDKPGGCLQKILSVLGHGGKTIKFYVFGPEYAFPGNCWSEKPERLAEIVDAMRVVGKAEDLLYPGQPVPAEVAILTPQSAQVWDKREERIAKGIEDATNVHLNRDTVDYIAETFNMYCALQHANIPTDWVDEQDLANGKYLRRFKVLYITAPNLPKAAVKGLERWVADGGTLVAIAGAGQCDEYDEPSRAMERLLGIKGVSRPRLYSPAHAVAKGRIVTSAYSDSAAPHFVAHGFEQILAPTTARALAQFESNGQTAVTSNRFGKGSAIVLGTLIGTAYNLGGQTESARAWLMQAKPAVEVDRPRIETPVLQSEKGMAITVLNWTGQSQKELKFEISSAKSVKRVVSVQLGEQKFTQEADKLRLTLPELGPADVLKLYW